ncbi:hypothetical protein Q73_01055 [Bacillus coahuilensis m2-6]|uniref:hypothetical protein n=1 Tax=Bacillus coahuilensis TaxID=408580 RepID=UPI0007503C88|nr:hypothetical protein [Bacillus coahuilensis]KUP09854.1 hypothetical protein Q73_01055 [Bacillus coahuilensis m2-6]
MELSQVEDIFDFYGYSELYKRFKTPLYVTGIMDEAASHQLEDFFDTFSFKNKNVLFDEFRYWWNYHHVVYRQFHEM